MTREELVNSGEYKEMSVAMEWYNSLTADEANAIDVIDAFIAGYKRKERQVLESMDLGEPPYLISVEQAYYRTKKLLEE